MPRLSPVNFIEELQDHIEDEAGLGYVVGTDLFVSNELDIDGDSKVETLTLYEEGFAPSTRERIPKQERTVRFLFRAADAQAAMNNAWTFVEWIGNAETFSTPKFRVWVLRFDKGATVTVARRSGTYVADVVVTFLVTNIAD